MTRTRIVLLHISLQRRVTEALMELAIPMFVRTLHRKTSQVQAYTWFPATRQNPVIPELGVTSVIRADARHRKAHDDHRPIVYQRRRAKRNVRNRCNLSVEIHVYLDPCLFIRRRRSIFRNGSFRRMTFHAGRDQEPSLFAISRGPAAFENR